MERPESRAAAMKPEKLGRDVPMAPLTTLELGGNADFLVEAENVADIAEAGRWAAAEGHKLLILGGGSNTVVSDAGWRGLAIHVASRGIALEDDRGEVLVTAQAGEPWDEFVATTVDENLAGLECLAGIPGTVGATPIQNVGAYGQEVASAIESVRVLDLEDFTQRAFRPSDCGFGYRRSIFRADPGRYVVTAVTFRLVRGGSGTVLYDELRRALGEGAVVAPLSDVHDTVLDLRRAKSMVIESGDPNRRSVGSFFVNPILSPDALAALEETARDGGHLASRESCPHHHVGGNRFKIPAAWLIEGAGFPKGLRRGSVGISDAHALALVHFGGGTSAGLMDLAREIQLGVVERFGIELLPEPVFAGFPHANPLVTHQSTE